MMFPAAIGAFGLLPGGTEASLEAGLLSYLELPLPTAIHPISIAMLAGGSYENDAYVVHACQS